MRKCSSDEDCKSKKKKCLCDGACGNSCIKPGELNLFEESQKFKNIFIKDRECPELPQPANGTVTFSNPLSGTVLPGNISGRTFGSRATYRCPHGSHVVGLQSRLCQAYGHWSGTEPSCKMNSEY